MVLVTGAGGFLGSAIVRQASAKGIAIRAGVHRRRFADANISECEIDIRNSSSLMPAMRDVTTVIHAAGLAHQFRRAPDDRADFDAINVQGALNVGRAAVAAGVGHLVLASSVSVFGTSVEHDSPDVICRPSGAYAESKHRAELELAALAASAGIRVTILRLATLYGEGDPGNVARLIEQIAAGKFIWVGRGSNRKTLLHCDDAASACLSAAAHTPTAPSQAFIVAGTVNTMHEVVNAIASALPVDLPRWHVPGGFARVAAEAAARVRLLPAIARLGVTTRKWLADDTYDGSRFAREYGFTAQVALEDGIDREVRWYRARRAGSLVGGNS